MIGQAVLHYQILEKLGEGGMGVVYKAEDTKLKRDVAIKFLPRQIAATEEERERFKIEARAAAALNHPNIATIHAIEELEDELFIVMEYIEGQELRDLIHIPPTTSSGQALNPPSKGDLKKFPLEGGVRRSLTGGVLPLEDILDYATQIAEGLQAAHEKGVTHRDIKSSNIMITDKGRVKIMDFGLAKVRGGAEVTKIGTTLGTAAYMSPEQAHGTSADHRTDIWSFGVVLYEMLTGELPFQADYEQAVIYSILNEPPRPIEELREDVPSSLVKIIVKALEKEPDARYQQMDELIAELKGYTGASSSRPRTAEERTIPSIAVLPFANKSADPDNEFFCDGLTEDITAGLSRFSHVSVVSASSAAAYKGKAADVRQVGKELGARFILEGSVRKAATNIRVTVQLLDAVSRTHLWAERFDRNLRATDIFAAQDDLTDRIVATVADANGVLTRSLAALAKDKPIEDLTADESVLCWFAYFQHPRPDDHAKVRTALEQAINREPNHADARACLALIYLDEFRLDYNPQTEPLERALKAAELAVETKATSQLAHRALAEAHYYRRELSAFRPAAERVLELNPRDTSSVAMIGHLISMSGDWAAGLPVVEKVMKLNPHHAGWVHFIFVIDHYRKREYEKALEAAEKVKIPGHLWSHHWLAAINAQLGRTGEAGKQLKILLELVPDFATKVRPELCKWMSAEIVEHSIEGLRKAGLDVPEDIGATSQVASKKRRVRQNNRTKRGKDKK